MPPVIFIHYVRKFLFDTKFIIHLIGIKKGIHPPTKTNANENHRNDYFKHSHWDCIYVHNFPRRREKIRADSPCFVFIVVVASVPTQELGLLILKDMRIRDS